MSVYKRKFKKSSRFIQIHHYLLKSWAWGQLSPAQRCAYLEIKAIYNGHNNGRIAISLRKIAQNTNVGRNTASLAVKRLIELGFVVVEKQSGFNRKDREATEYRLTEEPNDLTGVSTEATKEFMRIVQNNSKHSPTPKPKNSKHSPTPKSHGPTSEPKKSQGSAVDGSQAPQWDYDSQNQGFHSPNTEPHIDMPYEVPDKNSGKAQFELFVNTGLD